MWNVGKIGVIGLGLVLLGATAGCDSASSEPPAGLAEEGGGEGSNTDTSTPDPEDAGAEDSEEAQEEGGDVEEQTDACTAVIEGCTETVCPSDDDFNTIQNALLVGEIGNVICLGNGTFRVGGRLTIGTPGLIVRGAGQGQTILDFGDQSAGTKAFLIKSHGVILEDFTVSNYLQDGVVFENANDWAVKGLQVSKEWSSEGVVGDALRAIGGKRGRVEWSDFDLTEGFDEAGELTEVGVGCHFAGAYGAGIHLRGTEDAIVRGNAVIESNSVGVLLISATDSQVRDSTIQSNGAGVLIASSGDNGLGTSTRARAEHCVITKNNKGESSIPVDGEYSWIPPGTGVAVIASKDSLVAENSIQENDGYGVLLLAHRSEYEMSAPEDEDFAPYTSGTFVVKNILATNGGKPKGLAQTFPAAPPVPSLAVDGCRDESVVETSELKNCFSENTEVNLEGESSEASFVFFDACNGYTQIAFQLEDALANCTHELPGPIDVDQAEDCTNEVDDDDDGVVDCDDADCFEDSACLLIGGETAEEEGGETAEEEGGETAEEEGGETAEEEGGETAEEEGGETAEEEGGEAAGEEGGEAAGEEGGEAAGEEGGEAAGEEGGEAAGEEGGEAAGEEGGEAAGEEGGEAAGEEGGETAEEEGGEA